MMKNMFVIMCAMSVVAAAAKLTAAETVTVSSVDELTNAVARANAGEVDKIILRSGAAYAPADQWMFDNGTAKAFLHVTVDGLVIEGGCVIAQDLDGPRRAGGDRLRRQRIRSLPGREQPARP